MTSKPSPQELIAAWQAAYNAAHGVQVAPYMGYRNGWYRTSFNSFRRSAVEEITANLKKRVVP